MIKIGISGDAGSFSEEAVWLYARQAGMKPKLSYLIDMEGALTSQIGAGYLRPLLVYSKSCF